MDVLHTPLWNWLVDRLPMWLAPTLITLTGLLAVIAAWMMDAWYLTDYTGVCVDG